MPKGEKSSGEWTEERREAHRQACKAYHAANKDNIRARKRTTQRVIRATPGLEGSACDGCVFLSDCRALLPKNTDLYCWKPGRRYGVYARVYGDIEQVEVAALGVG